MSICFLLYASACYNLVGLVASLLLGTGTLLTVFEGWQELFPVAWVFIVSAGAFSVAGGYNHCLLYTSDAADE